MNFSIASTQFADQVATAMLAAQASDQKQFKHLSAATEKLGENSREVMTVVQAFATEKDGEILDLQKNSQRMKKELSAFRREMKKARSDEAATQEKCM